MTNLPRACDKHDAYRSELSGLYGIGKASSILEETGNIIEGKIEVGCNGLGALW